MVYQHAKGLVERGHEVTVVAPNRMNGLPGVARAAAQRLRNRWHGVAERPLWAPEGVRTVEVASPKGLNIDSYESVIATGHQTAPWVHRAMGERVSGRVYFIQGDERYQTPLAEATWDLPFTRISISHWLADVLAEHGAPVAAVIPNAVDRETFTCTNPPEGREPRVIALYHRLPVKGPDTLIDALTRLKPLVPEVQATVITARPPQHRLPSWVSVRIRPDADSLVELYNRAAVCLHTSRLEGWGLVPMEAAACGCAVVATASRGVSEYLADGRSMLQVNVGDANGLATHTARLLAHPEERAHLAQAGIEDVSRFSWESSTSRLESVLKAAL